MNTYARAALVTVAAVALLATGTVTSTAGDGPAAAPSRPAPLADAAVKPPQASTKIACEKDSSGRSAAAYDGESAGYLYDRRFSAGPMFSSKFLADYVPQGVAYWQDWNGSDDLLLVSAHNSDDSDGVLVALDPQSEEVEGTIHLGPTHAGALGIHQESGWLFVDGKKKSTDEYRWHRINTYDLDDVRDALSGDADKKQKLPKAQTRLVYGASFLTVNGDKVYAGKFNKDARDWMYRYSINTKTGELTNDPKPGTDRGLRWEIPSGTQGVAKSGGTFLFTSSKGRDQRSNIYATDASETNLDSASARCFRAPSMTEGITVAPGGTVYLMFESGAVPYGDDPDTRNVIPGTHTTDIDQLTGIPGGKIQLGTLHAKAQEDWVGEDEISIKIEGENILSKHIDIEEGQRKKVRHKTVQFTGNARVTLTELDPEGDDNLGTRKIAPGADHAIVKFEADDAIYRLSYTVR